MNVCLRGKSSLSIMEGCCLNSMKKRTNFRPFLPLRIFHITPADINLITGVHHHTAIELCCIVSGNGKIESGQNTYNFAMGDVFVFSPGEGHFVSKYSDDTDILCLSFEPHCIWFSQSGFSDTKLLDSFLNQSSKYRNKLPSKSADYVFANICRCEEELINMDEEYNTAIKIILADTLIYILRNSGYAKPKRLSSSRLYNLESLKKSMDYIDENLHEEIDLDVLARAANMSRSYFCTIFKRYNGIKPWDYITIKRIEKAIRLISVSGEKKLNIAIDCGFNNTANFYRAFKKITGKTPSDYETIAK